MTDKRIVLSTAGSEEEARKIARQLVERRLAACVNIVPQVQSIYRWKDKVEEASEWLPSGERSAEQQMLAREQVGRVWQSVAGLSERQRTVFLLRYVEEQELSEIARATGLSEGTVKAHLSRAVARVRAELGGKR